jgi:4-amino-4-deoxy-L-arabinose transferase-like glycosyltransferase
MGKSTAYSKKYLSPKYYVPVFLCILAIFFLIWNFNGDPSVLKRYGDYSDEGYWLQNPANKILHGTFLTDDQTQSYFGAPLYNQIITLQFRIFGVSFTSARIISLILLILTAYAVHNILQTQINQPLIFTAAFLLLFDNKIYYQWSTPVPLEMFFQAILLLFLIKTKLQKPKAMVLAIVLTYLGVLSKTTSIWLTGFVMLIFVIDNKHLLIKPKELFKFILYPIACVLPFVLLNLLFSHIEHDRFLKFSQLIKLNTNFNWTFLDNFLNPIYYIKQLVAIFKYPNSFLLVLVPFLFPFLLRKDEKDNKSGEENTSNRVYIIIGIYIICQILFLMIIGQFGYDRRQINLILPFFLLTALLIDHFSNKTLSRMNLAYISVLFVFIFLIQSKQLYHEIYRQSNSMGLRESITILSTSELMLVKILIIILIAGSLLMVFKYKLNYFLYFFISLNIIFHIVFINNGHTLKDGTVRIEKIAKTFNSKYVTGIQAHHLSVGTGVIPIWHLEKWVGPPYWNENFELFSPANPTIVLTNLNLNESIGYFPLKNIPKDYNVVFQDTLYLYKNKFLGSYLDTVLLHVVSHVKE